MIYRLLGELEIGDRDDPVGLPGGPTLLLLAALLLNANRQVPKAHLIRAAWGNTDTQEAQLHKRAGAVRDLLAKIGRSNDLKTHSGFGYEMRVAPDDVDSLLFQRLVGDAGRAQAGNRPGQETALLRRALELWRGQHPLSNVPGGVFHDQLTTLEQRRKRAAVRLFDLELALGHHERVLDQLIVMASYHPSDRRLCEQLMLAEYRCDHVTDALAAFERYRAALGREIAQEPDPLIRSLYFAIARGDGAAIATAETVVAKRAGVLLRFVAAVPHQLPRPAELVGRKDLLAEVSWLLSRGTAATAPVVVISGPGGIGKTALAVRAAHDSAGRYPDGQLCVQLRATAGDTADTGEILAQLLRAFGVARVPEPTEERLAAYRTLLADRRVLVLLDDAAGGRQAADLLPASPGCAVLITARQRLPEISGAHHVAPLEPLSPAEATEMFLRVVRDAGVSVDSDLEAAGRIVSLCGGLPLALRIAGALRVQEYPRPASELADRLDRQGPQAFAYGELSLARTIGASYDRLDPAARRLFLRLGLLPLPLFASWTAAALLDDAGEDAATALSRLAARFIVEGTGTEPRYRFHDLTRDYARRRALAECPGEASATPERAYRTLLTLARRAHARLYGGSFEVVHSDVPDWDAPPEVLAEVDAAPLDWFERERGNIRAAVGHSAQLGLTGICCDLAVSAHEFYTVRGYFDDWHATHTVALAACREAGDRHGEGVVLVCLNQPALVASRRADATAAVTGLQQAVQLLADSQDRHGEAIALRTLGNALRRQGHISRPLALFGTALAHYTASRDTVGQWQTLRFTGQTLLDHHRYADARRALDQARSLARGLGNERLIAQTEYWAGQACLATGDPGGAEAAFVVVHGIYRDDAGIGHAYAAHGLGDVARHRGQYGMAERHLAVAADLAREGGDAVLEGRVGLSVAALQEALRRPEEQIAALREATAIFAGCGAAYLEAQALAEWARAAAGLGDLPAARKAWRRVGKLWDAAGLPIQDRIFGRPF